MKTNKHSRVSTRTKSPSYKGLFGDEAEHYDTTIMLVDPLHEKLHNYLTDLAEARSRMAPGEEVWALDIGSGTGADSVRLLKAIPKLKIAGVDSSEEMARIFAKRATRAKIDANRYRILREDILSRRAEDRIRKEAAPAFDRGGFDLIFSGLTLHHFSPDSKRKVYSLARNLLRKGGLLLVADLCNYRDESPWLDDIIDDWEKDHIHTEFTAAIDEATDPAKIAALRRLKTKWLRHYEDDNRPDSVETQITWLKELGFSEVACPFRYLQMAIIFAVS